MAVHILYPCEEMPSTYRLITSSFVVHSENQTGAPSQADSLLNGVRTFYDATSSA
jgi:hypothetical protein